MMNRNVSGMANLFLMAVMLVGVWLANSSGTRLFIGLLFVVGSAAGLIFLARRENSLPLGHGGREAWKIIRANGKRPYILRSVVYGLFIGLVFIVYLLIRYRWTDEPFTVSDGFVLMAPILILYIGGSYYAAIRRWALYEERYKASLPQEAQPNKSFEMTPR